MMAGAHVVIFLVATSIGGDAWIFVPCEGVAALRFKILRDGFDGNTDECKCRRKRCKDEKVKMSSTWW